MTASATITLTISNQSPTAIPDNYFTDVTDAVYTVPDPTVNDNDSETSPLTIQTASVTSGPGSNLTLTGNTISLVIGHGVTTLSYTIVDGGGLTASSTITITSNRAPTIQPGFEDTNGDLSTHLPLDILEARC